MENFSNSDKVAESRFEKFSVLLSLHQVIYSCFNLLQPTSRDMLPKIFSMLPQGEVDELTNCLPTKISYGKTLTS